MGIGYLNINLKLFLIDDLLFMFSGFYRFKHMFHFYSEKKVLFDDSFRVASLCDA